MGKKYRCVQILGNGSNFTVGSIYEVDKHGYVVCDFGYSFSPAGYTTAIEWLEANELYKFEEVKDMFSMYDLKSGMMVELRDGNIGLVVRECALRKTWSNRTESKDLILLLNRDDKVELSEYYCDLKHHYNSACDIMKVCCALCYPSIANTTRDFERDANILFDRSKIEERKKLTVEEIERLLGYKVAIVDEEGK